MFFTKRLNMKLPLYTFFILLFSTATVLSQTYTTSSNGNIESSSTWMNGMIPPFVKISNDIIEVPVGVTLMVNHELTTIRNEVINRGAYFYNNSADASPTINWRNFGDMTLGGAGWATQTAYFINEESGRMLFLEPWLFCHHLGCGSQNYGTMYVNFCVSNPCATDADSGFTNKKTGKMYLCEEGYLENNWYNVSIGQTEYLTFTNEGEIFSHSSPGIYSNGVPPWGAQGTYDGNPIVFDTDLEGTSACLSELPELSTAISNVAHNYKIEFFPNPSKGDFSIKTNGGFDELRIANLYGQLVFWKQIQDSTDIQLSLNESGLFVTHFLKEGEVVASKKIVITQ